MTAFDQYEAVLVERLEGDNSNSPIDPGGRTLFGWSAPTRKRLGLPDDLTRDEAKRALRVHVWLAFGCEEMPPVVAWLVADSFFNHSPKSAALILQKALRTVSVDGVYGPITRQACAGVQDVKAFVESYAHHRRGHFARRSGELIGRYTREGDEDKLRLAIRQEHGWQRRLDRLFSGLWEAELVAHSPNGSDRVVQAGLAAVAAGATATVGQRMTETVAPVSDVVMDNGAVDALIGMAASGELTVAGVASMAAGWLWKRWRVRRWM